METFGIRVPQHIFWHMQWDEFLFTWISLRSATRQTRDKNMIFFLTDIVNCLPATGADIHNRSKHVPFDATVCQRRYIINYTQCERRKKCAIKLMLPLINVNHDENDAACQVKSNRHGNVTTFLTATAAMSARWMSAALCRYIAICFVNQFPIKSHRVCRRQPRVDLMWPIHPVQSRSTHSPTQFMACAENNDVSQFSPIISSLNVIKTIFIVVLACSSASTTPA